MIAEALQMRHLALCPQQALTLWWTLSRCLRADPPLGWKQKNALRKKITLNLTQTYLKNKRIINKKIYNGVNSGTYFRWVECSIMKNVSYLLNIYFQCAVFVVDAFLWRPSVKFDASVQIEVNNLKRAGTKRKHVVEMVVKLTRVTIRDCQTPWRSHCIAWFPIYAATSSHLEREEQHAIINTWPFNQ